MSYKPMPPAPKPRVAFIFYDNIGAWLGGRNYFRSLFGALSRQYELKIEPVVFIGKKTDIAQFDFPKGIQVIRHSVFDRKSLRWFIDRACKRVFKRAILSERVLLSEGISAVSHINTDGFKCIVKISWIPDFQHVHLPQFFSPMEIKKRNISFQKSLYESDIVLVSSESARQDIEKFAPAFADKVCVLNFCSIEPNIYDVDTIIVNNIYRLQRAYFYIPNQFWAHKNHVVVVEAMHRLAEEFPYFDIVCTGALVDSRNPNHIEWLRKLIFDYGLQKRFHLLGIIPYPHIAQLMFQAIAVINPSLFEGWSTTVEEAKALGVPLVLSDIPVHREQCPDNEVLFFAPTDPTSLAVQLQVLLVKNEAIQIQAPRILDSKIIEMHQNRMRHFAYKFQDIVFKSLSKKHDFLE